MHSAALLLALVATFTSTINAATVQAGATVGESGLVALANNAERAIRNSFTSPNSAVAIGNRYLTTSLPIIKGEIDALANNAGANAAVKAAAAKLINVFNDMTTSSSAIVAANTGENGFINGAGLRQIDALLNKSNENLNKAVADLKVAADESGLNAAVVISGVESTMKVNNAVRGKMARYI